MGDLRADLGNGVFATVRPRRQGTECFWWLDGIGEQVFAGWCWTLPDAQSAAMAAASRVASYSDTRAP